MYLHQKISVMYLLCSYCIVKNFCCYEVGYIYIYIYIYAFSRRFYPKRLTLHSSYSFYILDTVRYRWDTVKVRDRFGGTGRFKGGLRCKEWVRRVIMNVVTEINYRCNYKQVFFCNIITM